MNFLSTSQLASHLGVHPQTIRRWCKSNQLTEHHRTNGNHRRFSLPKQTDGQTVGYVRVSSHDQKTDLDTQKQALIEKAKQKNIDIDHTIQDIGSGMNYKKKGFSKLLADLLSGKIKHLIIMHKDRLLRFGSEIIFAICNAFHIQITILEPSPAKSPVELLCLDLIEIMTVFSSKIYGTISFQ